MSTLNQKIVLVTGASGGLGAEISREFAKAGAKLIVHFAGRQEPADKLVAEIKQAGGEAVAIQADVRKAAEVKSLFDSTSVNRAPIPGYGPYGATKSAVEHLTKVAAKEVGRGIRVNAVSPGPVNTELYTKGKTPELIARQAAMNPFNRIGETVDIAPVVVFLATDEAHWISGQVIPVNGAMLS